MQEIDHKPGIRPRPTLGRRLDALARAAFPASCTILLMVATEMPFGITDQSALMPAIALACVFFWSVFRPDSMPPPVVFGIGLLLDMMHYLPLGVGVLTLLVVHGVAFRRRRFLIRQGFLVVWLAFVLIAALAAAMTWGLVMLLQFRLLPPAPSVLQFALASAVYPALAILFVRAHRNLADPSRA